MKVCSQFKISAIVIAFCFWGGMAFDGLWEYFTVPEEESPSIVWLCFVWVMFVYLCLNIIFSWCRVEIDSGRLKISYLFRWNASKEYKFSDFENVSTCSHSSRFGDKKN